MDERTTPETPFLATGNTDRDSFRRALRRTWNAAGVSPLADAADAIHAALSGAGLTRLAAAMAWIEVKNWTWFPMATDAFGLPRASNNPWAVKDAAHPSGWAHYPDPVAAARAWLALLHDRRRFPPEWSLARFVARYAPQSDGNDPSRYGRQAAAEISALPLIAVGAIDATTGRPPAESSTAPGPRPPLLDLRDDATARRFGLAPWQRDRIVAKGYPDRRGKRPELIVLHIQDGSTPGSLVHWLTVEASSTVMVQRDGSILRILPDAVGPWTNGEVTSVSARARALMARFGRDLNPVSLTIEAEGRPADPMPDAQLAAVVWQVRDWLARYPWITPDRVIRHNEIDGVNRSHCPGPYYERVMAALAAGPPPSRSVPPAPSTPSFPGLAVPDPVLRRAFPLADPAGPITRHYVEHWAKRGLFPAFAWRETVDGWTYWSFPPFLLRSDGVGRVEAVPPTAAPSIAAADESLSRANPASAAEAASGPHRRPNAKEGRPS